MIDDFVSSYARGETPNPCVRCNEQIKFSALAARALALGFDALATGPTLPTVRLLRRRGPRQGPVLRAGRADRRAVAPRGVPDRRHPKPQIREEAARRGLAVAEKPDSHDICFIPSGDTGLSRCAHRGASRRGRRRRRHGVGQRRRARLHHRPAQGSGHRRAAPCGRPRYVTAIDADTATVHVGDAADLDVWSLTGERPVFTSGARPLARWSVRCRCARTAASPTPWPN